MKKTLLSLAIIFAFLFETKAQLTVSAGFDTTICSGGSAQIGGSPTATGGTGPYTYIWMPSAGLSSPTSSNPIASPATTTTYKVIVTDNAGAVDSDQVVVTAEQILINMTTVNASCFGMANGAITISVTGGSPPYTFLWSNGMTTQNASNMPAGAYTVTVTNGMGCSATAVAVITQPTALSVSTNTINVGFPGACNGAVLATVSGGVSPYVYMWSNSGTTQTMNNLCAGNYNATITDMNGCTVSAFAVVLTDSACNGSTLAVSINAQNISCSHSSDTLTLNITGGTAPYTNLWSTGNSAPSIIVSQAGVYTAWVTDSTGCTQSATDTITNSGIVLTQQSTTPASCNGITNGSVHINVTGGTPPYTYLWSNGATADSLVNTGAGAYILTVTDAASCSTVASYTIGQSNTNWSYYVYVTSTAANCDTNGTAVAHVQGGTSPFTYLWTNGDTGAVASALAPGIYTVTVIGADGCTRTGSSYIYTSCYNILQGRIINDLNGNCVLDSGETPMAFSSVFADGVNDYYGYTDAQGYYTINVVQGTYTVRPYMHSNCAASCTPQNSSYTHTFPGLGDTVSNIDFYLVQAPFDLYNYQSWAAFRPGFTRTVYIYYGSIGTDTINATLTFTYDTDLTFVSAANGGVHNATNHTITWTLPNIVPNPYNYYYYYYYYSSYVSADFLTPIGTPIGTAISNTAYISGPTPECDTTNNMHSITALVTNSQDPNKKEVSPAGDIYDETDSVLTYTIHFQNTGNDTAWFIVLKDTLSSYLNAASVRNITSSHPITEFNISGNGILTWVFNPIYLVDSATNPAASEGYVTFSVKKKSGLPIGTQISNTASIYFDYNDAVVTNTVSTRVADPNFIFNISSYAGIQVSAAPNPFTKSTQITVEGVTGTFNFELFDVTGKQMKKINALTDSRFTLDRTGLSGGVYFYSITTTAKQKAYGKLVVE